MPCEENCAADSASISEKSNAWSGVYNHHADPTTMATTRTKAPATRRELRCREVACGAFSLRGCPVGTLASGTYGCIAGGVSGDHHDFDGRIGPRAARTTSKPSAPGMFRSGMITANGPGSRVIAAIAACP
jgi:hypothetical protein